jgi:uncharacterized protein with HEPN domain
MKKDDRIYIEHILESFDRVCEYLDDVSYEAFLADYQKQDAVIRKIEVAGEATKRISPEFREKYSQIPWRAMAGMRDKLIHDYFPVDINTVWETATKEIPQLMEELENIIENRD